jgi:hypothetical protein
MGLAQCPRVAGSLDTALCGFLDLLDLLLAENFSVLYEETPPLFFCE